MFMVIIVLLMFVLPTTSVLMELFVFKPDVGFLSLVGKWFVFWGVGVRLFTAGLRQALQPQFTANEIFGITDAKPLVVVRELGFANVSIGVLGLCSVLSPSWILPSAIAGGCFYGLAVAQHLMRKERNGVENVATVSGIFMFLVLLAYVTGALWKF